MCLIASWTKHSDIFVFTLDFFCTHNPDATGLSEYEVASTQSHLLPMFTFCDRMRPWLIYPWHYYHFCRLRGNRFIELNPHPLIPYAFLKSPWGSLLALATCILISAASAERRVILRFWIRSSFEDFTLNAFNCTFTASLNQTGV